MKKKTLFLAGVLTFSLVLFLSTSNLVHSQDVSNPEEVCILSITSPDKDGTNVGLNLNVKGQAKNLPSGKHLWILVHRIKGYKAVWYPQGEGEIDPITNKWEVTVQFGKSQDIGYEFEIAVIVVNEKEHAKLMDYWLNAMQSGDWKPKLMPPVECPPKYRMVKKISHD